MLMKTAPRLLAFSLRRLGHTAITLPPWGIYCLPGREDDVELLLHETVHWRQYRLMGFWRYYLGYLYYQLRYGYEQNPMELNARETAAKEK